MSTGTWVDTSNVNVAALESELMDHWSTVGVSYTRFTAHQVTETVRAVLSGVARQGGAFVRNRDVPAGAVALQPDWAALVRHVIDARATQPRKLSETDTITYTRGDVDVILYAIACQDVTIVG